jgi:hypothetical protein
METNIIIDRELNKDTKNSNTDFDVHGVDGACLFLKLSFGMESKINNQYFIE